MNLERYVENGWLKREPSSPQETADQLGIVTRSMSDAGVQGISDDLRFYTSFNAILALANTALRARGYRTTTQPGHHTRTLETLEYTIGADGKLIRKLLAFSKKRNVASYDAGGSISDQELQQILITAENVHRTVTGWLRTEHPRLLHALESQKTRDAARRAALNKLATTELKEGHYEGSPIPEGGSDD